MNRSKNHLLYELYLEEEGYTDVFDKTKHISLGHLVDFFNEDLLPDSIDDYSERDFAKAAAFKEIVKLEEEELASVFLAIEKINLYHEKKND